MEKTGLRGRLFPTLRELEVRRSGYDGLGPAAAADKPAAAAS